MATLYIPEDIVVTVRIDADQVTTRAGWIHEQKVWAKKHDISLQWKGESTHSTTEGQWHECYWAIRDPQARFMFLLRWT